MRAFAKNITEWKEDLFFTVKLARQKLSKYFSDVTPSTGMLLISAHILDPFWKLLSFRYWNKGMDFNHEDETSYATQYEEGFLKYVQNEDCAKHRRVPVKTQECLLRSNVILSSMALGSCQSSFDPYDLSSDDEEYLTPNDVAEMTPGQSHRAERLLTTARVYLNSLPEAPNTWGQINPNLNDHHSDPMEISSTFSLLDMTDGRRQQQEMTCRYTDLSNVEPDIFSIIPLGVGVEASLSLGRDGIGWRQSKTTAESLHRKVVLRQFARGTSGILSNTDPELDTINTDNVSEMKKEAEEGTLHRMANMHDFLDMWQGTQNLYATRKESCAQNK